MKNIRPFSELALEEGMSESTQEILTQAAQRKSAAVLSLPSAGVFQHRRTRFLDEATDGVWLESIPAEQLLIESLIVDGQPCGVSFKQADQKIIFTAKALRFELEHPVDEKTLLPAVMIARPNEIKSMQWRQSYRAPVLAGFALNVRAWRIADHFYLTDKPPRTAELPLTVRDISIGGIGVTLLSQEGLPPTIAVGERLRVSITYASAEEFIAEGRIRSFSNGENQGIDAGVQFVKLQAKLGGRQVLSELSKIVGELQLQQVQRLRSAAA
jgi:c-di-GMP-binding flagellar brake protein YcgR